MRYEKEVQLRLSGDVARAQQFVGRARTLLAQLIQQDLELGGLDFSYRQVVLAPGVRATLHVHTDLLPIINIHAGPIGRDEPLVYGQMSLLRWMPEGFVLELASPSRAPFGFKTLPDNITERVPVDADDREFDGWAPFSRSIINTATHNYYPDELFSGMSPNAPLRQFTDRATGQLIRFPMGFALAPSTYPVELSYGLRDVLIKVEAPAWPEIWAEEFVLSTPTPENEGWQPVFNETMDRLVDLKSEEGWYIHNAQFLPYVETTEEAEARGFDNYYVDPVGKGLFEETNRQRGIAEVDPLYPPMRGMYEGLAKAITSEIARSSVYGHASDKFREGYKTFFERALVYCPGCDIDYSFEYRAPVTFSAGENVLYNNSDAGGLDLGAEFAAQWVSSPPHFRNMIADRGGAPTQMQYSYTNATLSEQAAWVPMGWAEDNIEPPISGRVASQIFAVSEFATHGSRIWYGVDGRVLSFDANYPIMPVPVLHRTKQWLHEGEADMVYGEHLRFNLPTVVVYFRNNGIPLNLPNREEFKGFPVDGSDPDSHDAYKGGRLLAAGLVEDDEHGLLIRICFLEAPFDFDDPPSLWTADYKFHDTVFQADRCVRHDSMPLPKETCAVSAEVSPSGKKIVATVHVRETLPSPHLVYNREDQYLHQFDFTTHNFDRHVDVTNNYGSTITHYEWDGGWRPHPLGKQQLDIIPVAIRALRNEELYTTPSYGQFGEDDLVHSGNVYHIKCEGEYAAIPAYDEDDSLKFLRVRVEFEQMQWGGVLVRGPEEPAVYWRDPTLSGRLVGDFYMKNHITFVYPDGTEHPVKRLLTKPRHLITEDEYMEFFNDEVHTGSAFKQIEQDFKYFSGVGWERVPIWLDVIHPEDSLYKDVRCERKYFTLNDMPEALDSGFQNNDAYDRIRPRHYTEFTERLVHGNDLVLPAETSYALDKYEYFGILSDDSGAFTSMVGGGDIVGTYINPFFINMNLSDRGQTDFETFRYLYTQGPDNPKHVYNLFIPNGAIRATVGLVDRTYLTLWTCGIHSNTFYHGANVYGSRGIIDKSLYGYFESSARCVERHPACLSPGLFGELYPPYLGGEVLKDVKFSPTGQYVASYSLLPMRGTFPLLDPLSERERFYRNYAPFGAVAEEDLDTKPVDTVSIKIPHAAGLPAAEEYLTPVTVQYNGEKITAWDIRMAVNYYPVSDRNNSIRAVERYAVKEGSYYVNATIDLAEISGVPDAVPYLRDRRVKLGVL